MSTPTRLRTLAALAAIVVFSGCCVLKTPPTTTPIEQPPPPVTQDVQEMAGLAFISYTGELLTGSDDEVEAKLAPCMIKELEKQPLTKGKYKLIWGPAVYKFEGAKLDDNMMYVTRDLSSPEKVVVGVRGTNAKALLDWLVEDFEVGRTVEWQWAPAAVQPRPRISEGTSKGLEALREMTPAAGVPGDEHTLHAFLHGQVKNHGVTSVTVAGHSLGGALAPALGLWLEDTRDEWDTKRQATVSVYGFAGPTPGDDNFAGYYDRKLGKTTKRVHNPYDIVPHTWETESIERIPGLYAPTVEPSRLLRELACEIAKGTRKHDYTQQLDDAPAIQGKVFGEITKFGAQAGCQHTCGYYRGLKLVGDGADKILPITSDCVEFKPKPDCKTCPEDRCEPCKVWGIPQASGA